jgi:hypothetical protein
VNGRRIGSQQMPGGTNAQAEIPVREGVTLESPFIGPGMRGQRRLRYFPCRLSLVPALLTEELPPDIVLVQTSAPANGTVSLGTEGNVLPAAIEAEAPLPSPPDRPVAETSAIIG